MRSQLLALFAAFIKLTCKKLSSQASYDCLSWDACNISGSAFADLLYDYSLIQNDTQSALASLKLNPTAPLVQTDRASAMTDLKAYCCQK